MKYEVYNREGIIMFSSDIRYEREIEKELIKCGYTIKVDNKKIK